jgi:hypothetical protein
VLEAQAIGVPSIVIAATRVMQHHEIAVG